MGICVIAMDRVIDGVSNGLWVAKINKPECGGSLMWSGVLGGHEFEPTYNTASLLTSLL